MNETTQQYDEIEIIKPNRVINTIVGGDANLKVPYKIAFVVNGARSYNDYVQVATHHYKTKMKLEELKVQQINEETIQSVSCE